MCGSRTQVYHALKHFKYHLFERCRTALEDQKQGEEQIEEEDDDEPVKDTVNKVFSQLQEAGWITKVRVNTMQKESFIFGCSLMHIPIKECSWWLGPVVGFYRSQHMAE